MLDVLLAIGIPLIAGILLTLWKAIANQKRLRWESTRDIALDMIFLALGSSGAVFNDEKVNLLLRGRTIPALMLVIFIDLLVASVLLYLRRFPSKKVTITPFKAAGHLSLGVFCLFLISGIIYAGSRFAEGHR